MRATVATTSNQQFGLTQGRLFVEAAAAGHAVAATRNAMRALYENGYISYPFTECEFLPAVQAQKAHNLISAISAVTPEVAVRATVDGKAPVFVEDFLWPHHAISPCIKNKLWAASVGEVAPLARETYLFVAKAYLAAISATTCLPEYRLLATGERARQGDEALQDDARTWSAVPRLFWGISYTPSVLLPTRRLVLGEAKMTTAQDGLGDLYGA